VPAVLRLERVLTILGFSAAVFEEGLRLAAVGDLTVDCSALDEADSVVIAMLVEWQRAARAAGHRLEVRGLSAGLASLATLYGVDGLLATA
jgi:phospholipid transport system transporter-binding protein